MEINLNRTDFVKALNVGGVFANKSKVLPILDCVKIKIKNGKGSIVSMDGENAINKRFDIIDADMDGTICVGYKDLIQYVKLIKDMMFTMRTIDDKKLVEIIHSKGKTVFPMMNEEEFPKMNMDDKIAEFKVSSALLNNWILDASKFTSNEELRPAFTGVYFYLEGGEFGFCSTDGRKLITDNVHLDGDCSNFNFIINAQSLMPICNSLQGSDEVEVRVGDRNTSFVTNDTFITARNIDAKYPNFKMIIPKDNNIEIKVSKDDFLSAIERSKLTASVSTLVKLNVENNHIVVESQDIDFNKKSKENVDCESNGNITIGFSATNIIDCLSTINTDTFTMRLKNESTAALFYENGGENRKEILLMPMLIN